MGYYDELMAVIHNHKGFYDFFNDTSKVYQDDNINDLIPHLDDIVIYQFSKDACGDPPCMLIDKDKNLYPCFLTKKVLNVLNETVFKKYPPDNLNGWCHGGDSAILETTFNLCKKKCPDYKDNYAIFDYDIVMNYFITLWDEFADFAVTAIEENKQKM